MRTAVKQGVSNCCYAFLAPDNQCHEQAQQYERKTEQNQSTYEAFVAHAHWGVALRIPANAVGHLGTRALYERELVTSKERPMKRFLAAIALLPVLLAGCAGTTEPGTASASLERRCKVVLAPDAGPKGSPAGLPDDDKAEARARLAASQLRMMQLRSGGHSDLIDDILRDCYQ